MAHLISTTFAFTGNIDGLSFYKRKDLDKVIIRRKGGPTKEDIKTSPRFDITRRVISEFGGRATASKYVMRTLQPLKPLDDYNIAGPINTLLKRIQVMDTQSEYGKRSVCLTKYPRLLEGFSLNKKNSFDSIVRTTLEYDLSREELSASLVIPEMIPGLNFFASSFGHPLYRFIITAGLVPDVFPTTYGYKPEEGDAHTGLTTAESPWYPVLKGSPEIPLQLDLKQAAAKFAGTGFSIMLNIGISFGVVGDDNPRAGQILHAGAAKVLGVR